MAAALPGKSSSTQASDNRFFLFRLQILIIDGGLAVLRNYVDQELSAQSITLSGCLANEKTTIKLLKGRKIITQVQYDLLYPSSGTVSTSDLDITLIICLMRNLKCFKLNKKFNWNISPGQSDTSIEADICRLKNYRNEICSISTNTRIQYNDFVTKWKEIEQILLRIDMVYPIKDFHQTITDFEYSPLDRQTEQRVTEEIEKWRKYDEAVKADLELLKAVSVPDEVASDPRTRELYQKALEKGTEKDNTIRVMVIGCFKQGKTLLVRNLLKQSIDGVETTNGIEMHKCTLISDEEWKKLDNEDLNKETIKRLVNIALKEKKDETTSSDSSGEKCLPNKDTLRSSSTADNSRTRNDSVSFQQSGLEKEEGAKVSKSQIDVAAESKASNKKVSYENLTSFHTELEISESIQGTINLENNVTLNIWDFGGQFVFYATHQIFHSKQAVYLLVFNLSISLDTIIEDKEFPLHKKTMGDYLKFWVASVNSFVGSSDGMKPAIVLVGTHRDKPNAENNSEGYFEQVRQLFDDSICMNHIQPEHFAISNTKGSESEFNALRTCISRLGQRHFEKIMPAKWILLEKALKINKQKKIITIDKLKQIDSETDSPLQTDNSTETMDQIKLFLSYHHAKGTFCYFDEDNLSNHVVLDPQFLVDAFRCVITSEKFCKVRSKLRNLWKELCHTAILRPELFEEVWRQEKDNNFYEFKQLLIEYMQKHHILAEALAYNLDSEPAVRRLGFFIVPSLLKTSSLSADTIRSYLEGKPLSTVSLCYRFENETLTACIFHACLAGIIGRWPLAKYIKTHVLFDHVAACDIERRHAGVLMLSENQLELLVVSLCPPDNVKADVCDMFRRYVEVVMMKQMHKLHTNMHEGTFFSRAVRCLHKDHGTKGSYGTFNIVAVDNIPSRNDEKIPCPDRRSHCLQMRSIVNEWFMPNIEQDKVPKRKLSKKEYSTLAMSIGDGWKFIGLELGLDNVDLDHICMNENDACMRIYNMFLKWDNKEADAATLDVIVQAITKFSPEPVHVKLDVLKNIINRF